MTDITLHPPATPAITITAGPATVGIPGPEGPAGPMGPAGPQGEDGAPGGSTDIFRFRAKVPATTGDPGPGFLRWNTVPQIAATELAIDIRDQDNLNVELGLGAITAGNRIYLQEYSAGTEYQDWTVTGPGINHAGYWTIPVTLHTSGGTGSSGFINGLMLAMRVTRVGIPAGGRAGQVLRKLSDADHDVGWADP